MDSLLLENVVVWKYIINIRYTFGKEKKGSSIISPLQLKHQTNLVLVCSSILKKKVVQL